MALYVPRTTIGEALPAAVSEALWSSIPGEELVREIPSLYSWLDGSVTPNGSGVYADRGPQGNNWIQATALNRPAQLSNWHGSGQNAFNFPNSAGISIGPNFHMPVGAMSIAVVFDINAALATNDNANHPLFGSALSAANSWMLSLYNNAMGASFAGGYILLTSAALAVNAPHSLILSIGPVTNALAMQIDGGTWQTVAAVSSINGSGLPLDTTGLLGLANWLATSYYYGAVAMIQVHNTELYDTPEATNLALLHSWMSAKYGATL